jgi:hypothetical protein
MQIPAANTSLRYPLNNTQNQTRLNPPCEPNKTTGQNTQCSDGIKPTSSRQTQNAVRELSEDEQRQLEQLKVTDREVRAHEAAHIAASGGLVRGGASFSYQAGPDGRMYAVGGEVSIDTSAVDGNPQATIQKAQTIRAAALAPAQPSSADHAAAAAASQLETSARLELAAKKAEEQQSHSEDSSAQKTENATDKPEASGALEAKSNHGTEHYQDTSKSSAPSDLIGQRLNATA